MYISISEGLALYVDEKYKGIFIDETFFVGPAVRPSVNKGFADYISVHLADTQKVYRNDDVRCDAAFVVISLLNKDGYVSLGGDVVCSLGALDVAKTKIAVVNKYVPYTFGDGRIPLECFDAVVRDDRPLEYSRSPIPNETEIKPGKVCAELVPDRACLQTV